MSERQNIEIDYCPKCRGVWLDRGELDKLIEKSSTVPGQQIIQPIQQQNKDVYHNRNEIYSNHYSDNHHKKENSWLSEIFD
jgi:Zn-finger nucleic acid-binding protein